MNRSLFAHGGPSELRYDVVCISTVRRTILGRSENDDDDGFNSNDEGD